MNAWINYYNTEFEILAEENKTPEKKNKKFY